jgi:hypothetical protein
VGGHRDSDAHGMLAVTVEYDCEGCGVHVINFGRDRVPVSGFCAVCEWLCEFVPDPEEMMALRLHLMPRDQD